MNIILTGSLGNISKPLARALLQKGNSVTVISSNADRQQEIAALGAKAAIGSMLDPRFLSETFAGADIVYLMQPPFDFFNHAVEPQAYWLQIAQNYKQAIQQSGVEKVVHLSSIGGHTDQGVGMLKAHYFVENVLKSLPDHVSIKTMRPVGFYYNMFAFIPAIKNAGAIISNYGGDEKEPWVSPGDIAQVIAEAMGTPFGGRTVQYIASDEVSPNELAGILGAAIGLPDLPWKIIPDAKRLEILMNVGMNPQAAKGLVEMDAGRRNGTLYADYANNRPPLSKMKVVDFAREFAQVFNQP